MSLGFCSGVIKMSNWKKRTFKLNASMLTYYDEKNVPKGSLAVSAMIQVDAVEEGYPATPRPIELGICARCPGNFAGRASSLQFIQEIIVGGS